MPYLHRFLAPSVEQSLVTFPCVFINGPRQSGKTTLAQMIWEGKDLSYVNFDDAAALAIASASPGHFKSQLTAERVHQYLLQNFV